MARHAPPGEVREMQRLLDLAEEIAAYEAKHDEIEAAGQVLEAHRPEFEALMDDANAATDRAHRLFAEDRFQPLRYTATDVYQAFEAVGYPQRYRHDPEDVETLVAAILHVADENYRPHAARRLLMLLPEYVGVGRYLDAWVIQYCALQTFEAPDESNPFLAEMFHYGFVEWAEQIEAQQEALLHELGIDRSTVAGMGIDEMESWLQAQMTDPAKKALVETYYATHSMMSAQAEAEIRERERDMLRLLERDDADALYLSPEEVAPWIPTLQERLAPSAAQARQAAERGEWDDPDVLQALGEALISVAQEMVPVVFTPERIGRLVADLKAYRRNLIAAGEPEAAMYAHTAYMLLEREETLVENPLLVGICFASLRLMMITLTEEAQAQVRGQAEARAD
jgi:hypothetical protein